MKDTLRKTFNSIAFPNVFKIRSFLRDKQSFMLYYIRALQYIVPITFEVFYN